MREMRQWLTASGSRFPGPERIVSADSTARVLLAAASRALRGVDCADLGQSPMLARLPVAPESVRRAAVTRTVAGAAVAAEQAGEIDAERVARWTVGHYPPRGYPGVVIGSPHGGAVHLATAMGMPWLPAAFEITVRWPDGAVHDALGAYSHGSRISARLLARNPAVRVRQVHDPAGRGVLAGSTVSLRVRWHRLPAAYRQFFDTHLNPGAPVLLLRDARTWPVLDRGTGHSLQIGGPASGLEPADFLSESAAFCEVLRVAGGDRARWAVPGGTQLQGDAEHGVEPGFETSLRTWAQHAGSPLHRVLFSHPEALSAAVADVYRYWLRAAGKTGNRCVVECGRLIDPWQVVRAGMVPYWCENASQRSVAGAEWWLAGSAPFSSVDVLPEPPGLRRPALASLPQWFAVASFGRRRRSVDRVSARNYPLTPVPTRRATEVLRGQAYDLPEPSLLPVVDALAGLRDSGVPRGLLVC